MGRYKEAPWGFTCPYKEACPHLGMSTTWASVLLSDLEDDGFRDGHFQIEAEKELKALNEENEKLKARIVELETRLKQQHRLRFKKNKQPQAADKRPKPGVQIPRKRGAPVGHPPWQREKPDRVDRSVRVPPPSTCPHCAREGLKPSGTDHVQLQEDIVLQPQTVITEYIHHMAYCESCRREVFATGPDELRNCTIGPVAKATAVYLRHEVKLSYRDLQKVFSGVFGMSFVPASAMAFSHHTAEQGRHLYEDLRNKIQAAKVAHGDETHWRIDGKSAFLWYAGNPQIAFYHADHSRSAEVAVSIFGSDFMGHFVADSYAAYNAINPRRRQACLAHLIRKAGDIADRIALAPKGQQDDKAISFCRSLIQFFTKCCNIDQDRRAGRVSFALAKRKIPALKKKRDVLCREELADKDTENLRQRLIDPKRDAANLFTFLKVREMPPTNNHAEQALRLPVIFRKISFGSRSLEGAQALATNLSLLVTAKRQKRNPIALIKQVLLQGPQTSIDALFDPDNLPAIDTS